jgi:hypothetical protein
LAHRSHPSFDSLGEGLLDSFPLPPPRARTDERSKTPTPSFGTWPRRIAKVEKTVDALQSDIWDWESDDGATITAATARGRPLSSWSGVFESVRSLSPSKPARSAIEADDPLIDVAIRSAWRPTRAFRGVDD